jgi:hypothetical protein
MKPQFVLNGTRKGTKLTARFPAVHEAAESELHFHRTLRVPNDGNVYSLPVGLEPFPLWPTDDFEHKLPPAVSDRGGVIMPMYRGEAMWIRFDERYPCAIKVGVGRVNALNGARWTEALDGSAHDYLAAPPQPALDGFRTKKDEVRQFVAVPRGADISVDMQVLAEKNGGIEIVVYPMKGEAYEDLRARYAREGGGVGWSGYVRHFAPSPDGLVPAPEPTELSLACGGRMRERIYKSNYGTDVWDLTAPARCIVTLIDAERWRAITGTRPPQRPFTPEAYRRKGLRWFEYYNDDLAALEGHSGLDDIETLRDSATDRGMQVLRRDTMPPSPAIALRPVRPPQRSRDPRPILRTLWRARRLFGRGR